MAWQDVETDIGTSRVGRCWWSVIMEYGGARVVVPKTVAAELGWTAETSLKVQVGTGDEAHMVRVVADRTGQVVPVKPHPRAACLQIRLGRWPGMPRHNQRRVAVHHETQPAERALVLHVPHEPALHVAPRSASKPAAAPQPPVMPARPSASIMSGPAPERSTAAKRDVTHEFFNDPKPKVAAAGDTKTNGRTF